MTRVTPERIEPDAILEAIVELRFDVDQLPEIIIGKLLSSPYLADWVITRLPQADIPYAAKKSDASLRYQPMYQLEQGSWLIRLSANQLSLHILPPYCGWQLFESKTREFLSHCWEGIGRPMLTRCGLRYVNALTGQGHGVSSIDDLNLKVDVGGKSLVDVTVTYGSDQSNGTEALVRIASRKHVEGDLPDDASFVVDIDIRNEKPADFTSMTSVLEWLEVAHELEKRLFFELLPRSIVQKLESGNASNII